MFELNLAASVWGGHLNTTEPSVEVAPVRFAAISNQNVYRDKDHRYVCKVKWVDHINSFSIVFNHSRQTFSGHITFVEHLAANEPDISLRCCC